MSLSKLYEFRNLREIDLRSQSRKNHILIYVRKIREKESTNKGLFIFMYRRAIALTLFTCSQYMPKRKKIEGKNVNMSTSHKDE